MKNVLAVLVFIGGLALASYLGGYLIFTEAIMSARAALDVDMPTALIVGITVIKCLLGYVVTSVIVWATLTTTKIIVN